MTFREWRSNRAWDGFCKIFLFFRFFSVSCVKREMWTPIGATRIFCHPSFPIVFHLGGNLFSIKFNKIFSSSSFLFPSRLSLRTIPSIKQTIESIFVVKCDFSSVFILSICQCTLLDGELSVHRRRQRRPRLHDNYLRKTEKMAKKSVENSFQTTYPPSGDAPSRIHHPNRLYQNTNDWHFYLMKDGTQSLLFDQSWIKPRAASLSSFVCRRFRLLLTFRALNFFNFAFRCNNNSQQSANNNKVNRATNQTNRKPMQKLSKKPTTNRRSAPRRQ